MTNYKNDVLLVYPIFFLNSSLLSIGAPIRLSFPPLSRSFPVPRLA